MHGETKLLVRKTKVLATFCPTKVFLRLVHSLSERLLILFTIFLRPKCISFRSSSTILILLLVLHFKAREMPLSAGKLRRLVKSKHSVVERHLNTIINLIRGAIENSPAFESIVEELKIARLEVSKTSLSLQLI